MCGESRSPPPSPITTESHTHCVYVCGPSLDLPTLAGIRSDRCPDMSARAADVQLLAELFPHLERPVIQDVLSQSKSTEHAASMLAELAAPVPPATPTPRVASAAPVSPTTPVPPAPRTPPTPRTAETSRTAIAAERRRTAAARPKRLLVIGEVGDGKSTLINALRDPARSDAAKAGRAARGLTKSIDEYVGKPVGGNEVVYLDTPGIGDMDVPLKDLFVLFEKTLQGAEKVDGVLVTTPVPDARVKLGAQVVQFLVSKGFVGGDEKWKNVIFVGTKCDKADADDRRCFESEVVAEMFAAAPGRTGAHVLVHQGDYAPLTRALPKLPNVAITYRPPPDELIQSELLPKIAGDIDVVQLAREMKATREEARKAAAKLEAAKGKVDSKGAYAAVLAKFGY